MKMTMRDHLDDACYMAAIVWPARVAAPAVVEWADFIANAARGLGLRRLAIRAAVYGYDVADHDPADSCWRLHRRLFAWAYVGGSFRPSHAMAAARLHERRYGDLV